MQECRSRAPMQSSSAARISSASRLRCFSCSATRDLKAHTLQADVVVAAVGKRNVLTADMVKPGAVVIDVGMNRDDNGKLCGDVDFAGVREVAGWITPVPGGVGAMTIACLMRNTVIAACELAGVPSPKL